MSPFAAEASVKNHRYRRKNADVRREDMMRPWPTLGYDRDRIAMHLVSREAFEVAESELRRAIWLNPYEPQFKVHLAWCLYRQKRYAEARKVMDDVPEKDLSDEARAMKRLLEEEKT